MNKGLWTVFWIFIMLCVIPWPWSGFRIEILLTANILIGLSLIIIYAPGRECGEVRTFLEVVLAATVIRLATSVVIFRFILLGQARQSGFLRLYNDSPSETFLACLLLTVAILELFYFFINKRISMRLSEIARRSFPATCCAEVSQGSSDNILEEFSGMIKFLRYDAIAGLVILLTGFCVGTILEITLREGTFSLIKADYALVALGSAVWSLIPALVISCTVYRAIGWIRL